LLLGGCASVGAFKGFTLDDQGVYVSGLPPIIQGEHYTCGAACVAAVAAYWNVSPAQFRAKYPQVPADTTGQDLQMLAEGLGLQAFAYSGSMDDLRSNLGKGRPMIVMIPQPLVQDGEWAAGLVFNAWNRWGPRPAHWVMVVGFTKNRAVIIHDPYSGPLVVKPEAFQKWWAEKGNLTVLITAM
jgi:ABC-type bacteriocin/lantibiotic exporter with double-glycine peptidase domain